MENKNGFDLRQNITRLLEEDDPSVLQEIAGTMICEAWSDEEPYDKKGRQLLQAYLEGDVDAFCIAMTGWTFEDTLKRANAIEDYDGVFTTQEVSYPDKFWFYGYSYKPEQSSAELTEKMLAYSTEESVWHMRAANEKLHSIVASGTATELIRPVLRPLDEKAFQPGREPFSSLHDGDVVLRASADDFMLLLDEMESEVEWIATRDEMVNFIKIGDVLVCDHALAVRTLHV